MSAWTRTIVVPLSIMSYFKPVRAARPERGIAELFREGSGRPSRRTARLFSWTNFFLGVDRSSSGSTAAFPRPGGGPAIRAAHRWMLEHCENTDGLGAIFPPMIYSIIALRCLGYDPDSPEVRWAMEQLDDLQIAEGDRVRVQPCLSPVWDTAIATIALADAGVARRSPGLGSRRATGCSTRKCAIRGDWQTRGPGVEPTGWHFQFHNAFYPDLDDSAMVLLALKRSPLADDPAVAAATWRGVELAALDAESRRRLGGLRRRHRQPGPHQAPVRRPQRDARPELRRHHGPGHRAARHAGLSAPTTPRSAALSTTSGAPRSPRAAGTAAGASITSTAPGRSCRG